MANDQDTKMSDAKENGDKKPQAASKKGKKKGEEDKPDLSEEDLELKANLEMMVERIKESDAAVQSTALDNISRLAMFLEPTDWQQSAVQGGARNCTLLQEGSIAPEFLEADRIKPQAVAERTACIGAGRFGRLLRR